MAELNLRETFKKEGVFINVTSAKLSDPTGTFGVKRNDTGAIVVADGTDMVEVSTGVYSFAFDEPEGETGLTYTYWVEWVYEGRTYRDVHTITGSVENDLIPTRQMDKYLTWIANEFKPLTLITPVESIEQCVENAIRYWNTHSAHRITAMYPYSHGQSRVQIDPEFKAVVDVLPSSIPEYIWSSHPLWTLTGITVLDNVTTDLIMMSEAFRNYRIYVGTNFRWTFQMSTSPTVGGFLYCKNIPRGAVSLFVEGTKRITKNEDIKSQYILDWILNYSKALVMQIEGNTLRKTAIIDTPLDGQQMVTDGRADQKELRESLAKDARWIIFMKRK